jgi:hypothetical protein
MCVKDNLGIGKPIYVDFYAPINESNPDLPLVYEDKSVPNCIKLLEQQRYDEFAN